MTTTTPDGTYRPLVWTPAGEMTVLGMLPGTTGHAAAVAINDRGDVVGISGDRPFLWTASGGLRELGRLPGATSTMTQAIGEGGHVVGTVGDSSVAVHLFVRRVATTLAVTAGNGQSGVVSRALGEPIVVRVTDRHGDGVEAETVRLDTGDGSFAPEWITTGATGTATTSWTLGPREGMQRATAHVDGLAPAALTAEARAAEARAAEARAAQVTRTGNAGP